jgi:biopolymer transport protein ExbD
MRRTIDDQEEVNLSITPLIDVTFLLLIFFMCAMKFKTLERKIAAFLPTDKGLRPTVQIIPHQEKITVLLKRERDEQSTRVKLLDAEIGRDARAFELLDQRLKAIRSFPENGKMPGEINAGPEVPHSDVVRCLDAFMKAGIHDLEFVGTAPPGRN